MKRTAVLVLLLAAVCAQASTRLSDLLGRRFVIVGKISQRSLATSGTFPIYTAVPGYNSCLAVVLLDRGTYDSTGTLTASIGSGSAANDFLVSSAIAVPPPGAATTLLFTPTTRVCYQPGTIVNLKITGTATGSVDVTAFALQ